MGRGVERVLGSVGLTAGAESDRFSEGDCGTERAMGLEFAWEGTMTIGD